MPPRSKLIKKREHSPVPSEYCKKITSQTRKVYQRIHLVVDLDATIVSTMPFDEPSGAESYARTQQVIKNAIDRGDKATADDLKKRVHIFSLNDGLEPYKMWTILRPDVFEFFEFAALYFSRITIWSAGKEDYVNEITALLFPPYMPRPELVLSWGDCMKTFAVKDSRGRRKLEKTTSDSPNGGYGDMVAFGKPLNHLTKFLSPESFDLKFTLIIDDRSDIAVENMKNLVQVPPYSPSFSVDGIETPDTALSELTQWLMTDEVSKCNDVQKLNKSEIFSTSDSGAIKPKYASPSHKIK